MLDNEATSSPQILKRYRESSDMDKHASKKSVKSFRIEDLLGKSPEREHYEANENVAGSPGSTTKIDRNNNLDFSPSSADGSDSSHSTRRRRSGSTDRSHSGSPYCERRGSWKDSAFQFDGCSQKQNGDDASTQVSAMAVLAQKAASMLANSSASFPGFSSVGASCRHSDFIADSLGNQNRDLIQFPGFVLPQNALQTPTNTGPSLRFPSRRPSPIFNESNGALKYLQLQNLLSSTSGNVLSSLWANRLQSVFHQS
uniref:Uncharacterized protein n=1 Tax=Ciona savignyi TaxID=51511 RepID=H2Y9Z7_CIOSA